MCVCEVSVSILEDGSSPIWTDRHGNKYEEIAVDSNDLRCLVMKDHLAAHQMWWTNKTCLQYLERIS